MDLRSFGLTHANHLLSVQIYPTLSTLSVLSAEVIFMCWTFTGWLLCWGVSQEIQRRCPPLARKAHAYPWDSAGEDKNTRGA